MSQKFLELARFGASTVVTCVALSFLAQGATGSNRTGSGSADACEDLYSVACSKSELEKESQEKVKAAKLVAEARDSGARAYGYADFFDGLSKELEKNGLKLANPLDEKAKAELLEQGALFDNLNSLQSGQACMREQKQLREEAPSPATEQSAEAFVTKARALVNQQRQLTIRYYSLDLSSFTNKLGSECIMARSQEVGPDDIELARTLMKCEKLGEITRQAGLLSRESLDNADVRKRVEAFVATHLEKEDLSFPITTPVEDESADGFKSTAPNRSESSPSAARTIADSPWDKRVSDAKSKLVTACAAPNSAALAAAAKVYGEYASRINRSPQTIDSLAANVYSAERRQKVESLMKEAQGDLNDVISQVVPDSAKRAKIQSGYDSLKLEWMEKPAASLYSTDASGRPSLDSEKYQRAEVASGRAASIDIDELTADPTLSGFKTQNAFYNPERSAPALKYEESIEIAPGFLPFTETNPEALRTLIGHELAHRVGSFRGLTNGFDLKAEYAPLLACYADSKSIAMKPSERDEVISDYLASEVLARRLSRLPASERRSAAVKAMAPLCAEKDGFEKSEGPRPIHPRSEFRISGIFGASPNLRSSLGCSGAARDFKSCGLPNKISTSAEVPAKTGAGRDSGASSGSNGSAR